MDHGPIPAQIQVPAVFIHIKPGLLHAGQQNIITFFTLGAAHQFANSRHQDIHGSDCFFALIKPHVKRFDLLWIIGHDHRPAGHLLTEEPFMLSLHVHTPENWNLKFSAFLPLCLQKDINGLGIGKTDKGLRTGGFKFIHQSLGHKTVKQVQVIGAGVKDLSYHGPDQ